MTMARQKSKRERQQGLFQVGGVFVFLTVVGLFFILGLGDETETLAMVDQPQEGMNYNLPDPEDMYASGSKLEAVKKEHVRLNRENTQRLAQNASFDMLNSLNAPKEIAPEPMNVDVEGLLSKIEDEPADFYEEEDKTPKTARARTGSALSKTKVQTDVDDDQVKMDWVDKELAKTEMESAKRRLSVGMATHEDSLLLNLLTVSQPVSHEMVASSEGPVPTARSRRGFSNVDLSPSKTTEGDVVAFIHGEHRNLKSSDQVRMRLSQAVKVGDVIIPKNTVIYGFATFGDTRIDVKINNIEYQNNIYAFNGTVYDTDGGKGLYTGYDLVNATLREAASDSYNRPSSGGSIFGSMSNVVNRVADKIDEARKNAARKDRVDLSSGHKLIIKLNQ